MATQTKAPQTKVVGSYNVTSKSTGEEISKLINRPLGSPINGKAVGEEFHVTLTGKIEIREFDGVKGAYFLTKEGYSIKVNASFDANIHKANADMLAVCREIPVVRDGKETTIKFCAFVG